MKLRVRTKLFFSSVMLIALCLAVSYGYLRGTLTTYLTERIEQDLGQRLKLVAYAAQQPAPLFPHNGSLQTLARKLSRLSDARVTLLLQNGSPLADSEVEDHELASLPNHLDRPEIEDALKAGYGQSTRRSTTLQKAMMYVAMPFPLPDGRQALARLSMPLTDVEHALARLHFLLSVAAVLCLGVAVLLSSLAAHLLARSLRKLTDVAHRMALGDLDTRTQSRGEDELAGLGRDLDSLAEHLSHALSELGKLETLRREFVANASHELRTPLSVLLSAVETLQAGAAHDPKAASQFHDIIYRQAERLRLLVNDLLDLSRLSHPGPPLSLAPLRLFDWLPKQLAVFFPRAKARSQTLHALPGDPDVSVQVDEPLLSRALSNLLDNAIKYCRPGDSISVGYAPDSQAGRVRLFVTDTGPGIEPQHLPRLFERFYRIDPGRSRELYGTGLGLSIVRHAVESMHGQVSVASTVGEGTTFTLFLVTSQGTGF